MPETQDPWQEIKHRLEVRKAAVDAEIAAYPPPIPACDVQFNHLLEQRTGLARELKRLVAAMTADAGADALRAFAATCPYLADEGGGRP